MHTFLTKLNLEKLDKKHYGIMFLVGLLLVIIAMPTSGPKIGETQGEQEREESQNESVGNSEQDYKVQLETELETLLAIVDGVGKVEVMITLEKTTQKVIEKDVSTRTDEKQESTVYFGGSDGDEPYVNTELYPTVEGVLVVAQGGANSIVVQNIKEAIQALFQVDTHKIKIMKMISSE